MQPPIGTQLFSSYTLLQTRLSFKKDFCYYVKLLCVTYSQRTNTDKSEEEHRVNDFTPWRYYMDFKNMVRIVPYQLAILLEAFGSTISERQDSYLHRVAEFMASIMFTRQLLPLLKMPHEVIFRDIT